DTAAIADDQVGVGSYRFLNIPQKLLLQTILDSISKREHFLGTIEQKVGDFYASGMDTATINSRGADPVLPFLTKIDNISDVRSMMQFVADEMKSGNFTIIGLGVWPDSKRSNINIAHASQTGIGLPERDYYFRTDSSTVTIQRGYRKYIQTLFELAGQEKATSELNAARAYGIEEKFARVHKTRVELRDVNANYNKMAVAELDK